MKFAHMTLAGVLLLGACGGDGIAASDRAYAYVLQKEDGIIIEEKYLGALGACVNNATQTIVSGSQHNNESAQVAMGLRDWAETYQSTKVPPASANPSTNFLSGQLITAAYNNCSAIPHTPARNS